VLNRKFNKRFLIFEKVYLHYHYFRCKWSQNNNIIIYCNNFLDNLSSRKICYRDRPRDRQKWFVFAHHQNM